MPIREQLLIARKKYKVEVEVKVEKEYKVEVEAKVEKVEAKFEEEKYKAKVEVKVKHLW